MLSFTLQAVAAASLVSSVLGQQAPATTYKCGTTDLGNGVHGTLTLSLTLTLALDKAHIPDTPAPPVPGAIPKNLDEPLQHRLAFAGPTGMTVSWSSFNKQDSPTVWCACLLLLSLRVRRR